MEERELDLRVDQIAARAEENTQLEGRITLKEEQAEIARIIGVTATLIPQEAEVRDGAVEVAGRVVFEVLYVSRAGEETAAVLEAGSPFTHTVKADGAKRGMTGEWIGYVTRVEEQLLDPRTVEVTADVSLRVWALETERLPSAEPMEGLEIHEAEYSAMETLEHQTKLISVDEAVEIPPRSLPVGEILSQAGFAVPREVTGTVEGTHVEGELVVFVYYFSTTDDRRPAPVFQNYSFTLPISFDLEWDQRGLGENARVVLVADRLLITPEADEMGEPRMLRVTADILCSASLWEEKTVRVPDDAYLPGHLLEAETQTVFLRKPPVEKQDQRMLRFSVTLPAGYPLADTAEALQVRPAVRSIVLQEDAVLVIGSMECDLLYRSGESLHGFRASIPFEERFSGVRDADAVAEAYCEKATCAILGREELDCRVQLCVRLTASETVPVTALKAVKDQGIDPAPRSAIIMTTVRAGDDLWSIAKRFGVAQSEVLRADPQYADRAPTEGEKLLLYRQN